MSDFNPLIASRYAELVRRWLGEDIQLGAVAPEIIPAFLIEGDDFELALLKEERLWAFVTSLAAVAAVENGLLVLNPAGSNMIITVDEAACIGDNAIIFQGQLPLPANYNAFDNTLLTDQRTMQPGVATLRRGVGQVFTKIAGATSAPFNRTWIVTSGVYTPRKIVLGPGNWCAVEQNNPNIAISPMFGGRERRARPEELGGF